MAIEVTSNDEAVQHELEILGLENGGRVLFLDGKELQPIGEAQINMDPDFTTLTVTLPVRFKRAG